MKEIQPGMMAIIIHDQFVENLGRVVVVGNFHGTVNEGSWGEKYEDGWEIEVYHDQPLKVIDTHSGETSYERDGITSGRYLMPLGDDESRKVQYGETTLEAV